MGRRIIVSFAALLLATSAFLNAAEPLFKQGKGMVSYACKGAFKGKTIQIYYYIPEGDVRTMPVQFVCHGMDRNGDDYRDSWVNLADKYGCVIIVPTYSLAQFPNSYYQLGNVRNPETNEFNPQSGFLYNTIDEVFDFYRKNTRCKAKKYNIYGHSAGGQFVHRYMLFSRRNKVEKAIAANPGYYTFPTDTIDFAFGLGETMVLYKLSKKAYYAKNMTILLGTADTLRTKSLNQSPGADRQGRCRLERGKNFFKYCKDDAESMGVPFNWKIDFVEGSPHSNTRMSPKAAELIYAN